MTPDTSPEAPHGAKGRAKNQGKSQFKSHLGPALGWELACPRTKLIQVSVAGDKGNQRSMDLNTGCKDSLRNMSFA